MNQIEVTVTGTIRRPLAEVSRQFGDIRHHAANRVHPKLTFTILEEHGESVRFRQQVSLVGMKQVDEIVQTRRPDGSLESDIVDGTNKGSRLTQTFAPEGGDATRITLTFRMPATGVKRLLKPLFAAAIRKTVVDALAEDRFDLEVRGYRPAA
jgi:hypothetical protein